MRNNSSRSAGFTIIELTLAMTMLSILMFILLISSMNIISIYNKGITLKRANQSGRSIGEELQANLRRAKSSQVNIGYDNRGEVRAICTGGYSFVWSTFRQGGSNSMIYYDGDTSDPVYFAKVSDDGNSMCNSGPINPQKSNSIELLGDGLVVRSPELHAETSTNVNPGKTGRLITLVYTISTDDNSGGIITDTTGRAVCQGGKEGEFCALNTFVVTSYAKGGV